MATLLQNSKYAFKAFSLSEFSVNLQQTRTKLFKGRRGKPPHLAKSWVESVRAIERHEEVAAARVNIGFPQTPVKVIDLQAFRKMREEKDIAELEKKAWRRELEIPIEECTDTNFKTDKQHVIKDAAEHYGVYRDLYNNAFFYPQVQLEVLYECENDPEVLNPVYYGNILPPSEVKKQPCINYTVEEGKLYTLCMTAPDSHLQERNKEYLHWLVGNIPGNDVGNGEVLCDYLVPFPVLGTGLHRYVFVLYQQDRQIDFTEEKRPEKCTSLRKRTFETFEFLRKYQDDMTPVGLAFFQAEYDETVRSTFHDILNMNEPRYEFYPPLKYVPRQKKWPIREPFNVYLDRYRDVKDINEEVLLEKLKTAHPFKPRDPPMKYPNSVKIPNSTPSWIKLRLIEKRLRKSYWKALDD